MYGVSESRHSRMYSLGLSALAIQTISEKGEINIMDKKLIYIKMGEELADYIGI
jgi:hypothetical protein